MTGIEACEFDFVTARSQALAQARNRIPPTAGFVLYVGDDMEQGQDLVPSWR